MTIEIKENALYTSEDLAEILQLSVATVQRMLKDGTLPGFKLGSRRWYVLGKDLLAMGTGRATAYDVENVNR
jgi:excisionase family DNA binding protein